MNVIKDKESGNLRLPHRVDEATGMYRGKQIFTPKVKVKHEHAKEAHPRATEAPHPSAGVGEHAHEAHLNAEAKTSKGFLGKFFKGRARARSGFGGGA